jgi:hypothetical protein
MRLPLGKKLEWEHPTLEKHINRTHSSLHSPPFDFGVSAQSNGGECSVWIVLQFIISEVNVPKWDAPSWSHGPLKLYGVGILHCIKLLNA